MKVCVALPDTAVYILQKNQTTYCNCKRQFLLKRNTSFKLDCTVAPWRRDCNLTRLILSQWGSEVWKDQFQFTERSLATCNTYNCRRQHFLQSNSKNVRTSRRDSFTLHDFYIFQSRIFLYNCLPSTYELYTAPKLSHIDFSFSQSGSYKGLERRTESQIWTESVALNTSNKSLL